jgi:hypothetical protein
MKESDWRYLVDALLFICLGGMDLKSRKSGILWPSFSRTRSKAGIKTSRAIMKDSNILFR